MAKNTCDISVRADTYARLDAYASKIEQPVTRTLEALLDENGLRAALARIRAAEAAQPRRDEIWRHREKGYLVDVYRAVGGAVVYRRQGWRLVEYRGEKHRWRWQQERVGRRRFVQNFERAPGDVHRQ